ncbi:MAG: hypothetical protein OXE42_03785 [Gammaproteobacteria bacterium]|nr:hypothetical protein [Gammaproteobacteria bacterium]
MIVAGARKATRTLVNNGFSDTRAECLINTFVTNTRVNGLDDRNGRVMAELKLLPG